MTISIIVAASENNVIGAAGDLPWRLSDDLKRFKAITMRKPIVMGRKTWDSIGRPLPGRRNVVITRQTGFAADGCDIFLGVPFNIASYALLTHMLAQQAELKVGDFIWTGGDCHLYLNHLEQANEQLAREPLPLPTLAIKRRPPSIFDYAFDDFEILNYEAHPHIKAAVAV